MGQSYAGVESFQQAVYEAYEDLSVRECIILLFGEEGGVSCVSYLKREGGEHYRGGYLDVRAGPA